MNIYKLCAILITIGHASNVSATEPVDGQKYHLRGPRNSYVAYDGHGNFKLGNFSEKAAFVIEKASKDRFAFKVSDGEFLCALDDQNKITTKPHVQSWETFAIEKHGEKYYIKSYHNTYLRANLNSRVFDQSKNRQEWEALELLKVGNKNSHQKRYLHVLLHGKDGTSGQMTSFLPKFFNSYLKAYPEVDPQAFGEQFELFCPQGANNRWFVVPGLTQIPYLFAASFLANGVTDSLPEFRENLGFLRAEIEKRLIRLGLGYESVILSGQSMGAITSLTLALESPAPVLAVLGGIGMWMPSKINSIPKNIFLTNGGKDGVIPSLYSSPTQEYLSQYVQGQTNLEVHNFPNDGHVVSQEQIDSMVKFLHNKVLN